MSQTKIPQEPPVAPPPVIREERAGVDLLRFPIVRSVARSRYFPLVFQVLTFLVLVYALYQGFYGTWSEDESFTTQILFFAFWPVTIIFTVALLGRIWCAVCPLGAITAAVERVGLRRPVPPALRTLLLPLLFFVGILWWVQPVLSISQVPLLTAAYFAFWVLLGVVSGFLFRDRAWCRYFCPITSALAVYSTLSVLSLEPRKEKCKDCRSFECVRGNGETRGCPMFEFPGRLNNSRNCIFCMNCIKACPIDGISLELRLPGREIVNLHRPQLGEVFIVMAVIIVFPVMMTLHHAWGPPWLHELSERMMGIIGLGDESLDAVMHSVATTISIVAVAIAFALAGKVSAMLSGLNLKGSLTKFGFAFVPYVFFAQLGHVLVGIGGEGQGPIGAIKATLGIYGYESMALVDTAGTMFLRTQVWPMLTRLGAVVALVVLLIMASKLDLPRRSKLLAVAPYLVLVILLLAWREYGSAMGAMLRMAGM